MTGINTNIFVIIVHTFLLTTTWCLMMRMDYTRTHLKQKGRLVPLKACRVVSLIFYWIYAVCLYFWNPLLNLLAP